MAGGRKPALCVSIDVESDMPRWVVEPETTLENIKGIPRLQELFDEIGIRPTYLVTYPVADTPSCVDVFRPILESGRCEIGMHCHPWTTPPISDEERLVARFLSDMPPSEVETKFRAVTEKIREAFGISPVTYRAGRFGLAPSHLPMLEDLGFLVDTSVTPLVSWVEEGGPDYRDAPLLPYHPNYLDVTRAGNSRLLEVPVTITTTRSVPGWVKWAYLRLPPVMRLRGLMSRDRLDLVDVVWAYPAEFSAAAMIRAAEEAERSGSPVVNFFMHSNEIWPGQSPYCKDEAELDAYLDRLGSTLRELVDRRGLIPMTLEELREELDG